MKNTKKMLENFVDSQLSASIEYALCGCIADGRLINQIKELIDACTNFNTSNELEEKFSSIINIIKKR